ncbi:MAG: tetratricopeptide repeat protein, partial [Myxococcaceae bacterium]
LGLRTGDVAELSKAAELAPSNPELHYRLGLAQLKASQFSSARQSLERATELSPNDASYRLPLAKALAKTGERQRAVAEIWRAVQAGQSLDVARALMDDLSEPLPTGAEKGLAALERDQAAEAVHHFDSLLLSQPDSAVLSALYGLALMKLDNSARALFALRKAVALAPEDGKLHLYLADFYRLRQRPTEALTSYENATRYHPLLDQAHAHAAQLAMETGAWNDAARHFRALTYLMPSSPAPRVSLAAALHNLGDAEGATRELRTVLAKHPDHAEAARALALWPPHRR